MSGPAEGAWRALLGLDDDAPIPDQHTPEDWGHSTGRCRTCTSARWMTPRYSELVRARADWLAGRRQKGGSHGR